LGLVTISAVAAAAAATESTAASATVAAAATATATVTATATAAATTATGAVFAGTSFVHGECAAVVFLAVEGADCGLGFFIRSHLDETEPFAASGVPVADDFRALHGSVLREQLFKIRAGGIVAQVPNIQLAAHG
jgi:hypothetical protein